MTLTTVDYRNSDIVLHGFNQSQPGDKITSILINVGKTMPFLPPITGNGVHIPPIKVLMTGGLFMTNDLTRNRNNIIDITTGCQVDHDI